MRTLKYTTGHEILVSRIPGLFAYTEVNQEGYSILHKATDSPLGCYGKVVENIVVPKYINVSDSKGDIIIEGGKIYQYRTLMDCYYHCHNETLEGGASFVAFMDEGIGKVKVVFDEFDEKKHDLVPEYVFLSCVNNLYNELKRLKSICDFYEERWKENKKLDNKLPDFKYDETACCECILYRRNGGDGMLEFLQGLLNKADEIAEKFVLYVPAPYDGNDNYQRLALKYPVNLFSTTKDLGLVTPAVGLNYNTDINLQETVEINQITDSKLSSLKRDKNYYNFGTCSFEKPSNGYDWLYYYRVGLVRNVRMIYDELGNIDSMDFNENADSNEEKVYVKYSPTENQMKYDLWAFGDVIEDIIRDRENRSITFVYWTDVHLKSKCLEIQTDDDGNKIYCYGDFEPDYNFVDYSSAEHVDNEIYPGEIPNYHGVKCIETYFYNKDSEINDLTDADFYSYVRGDFDIDNNQLKPLPHPEEDEKGSPLRLTEEQIKENDIVKNENNEKIKLIEKSKLSEKYEFITYNNRITYQKNLGDSTFDITVNTTELSTKAIRVMESSSDPRCLMRREFYNGISYPASEELDVYIDRGTVTVFDRHMRLSEIKTLNDMEEYANGSYFEMSKDTE